jgi:hypothetical protein
MNQDEVNSEQNQVLYDADAVQRIPVKFESDEGFGEVVHIVGPCSDEAVIGYDMRREVKLGQAAVKNAVETKSATTEGAIELYNEIATGVEGYGEPGEDPPSDWQDHIEPDEKQFVIEEALLACEAIAPTSNKKLTNIPWGAKRKPSSITVRCLFSGEQIDTEHFPRNPKPSADESSDYKAIQSSVWLVQGTKLGKSDTQIPPKMARLAKLYDRVFDEKKATGYRGRVPKHHKAAAIQQYMSSALELQEKK